MRAISRAGCVVVSSLEFFDNQACGPNDWLENLKALNPQLLRRPGQQLPTAPEGSIKCRDVICL